ncbi:MAG: mandelate racemase/muconate lactonizing enzyme family protein [Bryobacteraceae bacterium]
MADNRKLRHMKLAGFTAQVAMQMPRDPALEITGIAVHPLREPASGRTYTVLRLHTRGGITGYGECRAAPAAEINRVREVLQGLAATAFEVAADRLEKAGARNLAGAVNTAMLDVAGRAAKAPVYQLLGGPTRHKARALAPLTGDKDEVLAASMQRAMEAGFRAFSVPIPPPTHRNQGQAWALAVQKRLETLRKAAGENADFVLDGGAALSPGDASSAAAAVEKLHLLWFDEPCPLVNMAAIRRISQETVTPVGLGRTIDTAWQIQDLLREDAIDVIRPSISRCGIAAIRRMAAIAETHYIAAAPYHDGGPVATAAALQLAASLPNFYIQQVPLPEADRRMRAEIAGDSLEAVRDGFLALPTGPGLGFAINEKALEKYRGGEA